jgi:hypothetical protein
MRRHDDGGVEVGDDSVVDEDGGDDNNYAASK